MWILKFALGAIDYIDGNTFLKWSAATNIFANTWNRCVSMSKSSMQVSIFMLLLLFVVTLCCQYCCAAVVIIGAFYCCCCCCCYWLIVLVSIRAMRSSRFPANTDWVDSSKVWVVFQMQRLYCTHTHTHTVSPIPLPTFAHDLIPLGSYIPFVDWAAVDTLFILCFFRNHHHHHRRCFIYSFLHFIFGRRCVPSRI